MSLKTVAEAIKVARKERGFSQSNLAERLNVSRYTVMAIEKGDPTVAIGTVLEAAMIVGLRLLGDDEETIRNFARTTNKFNTLLPKRIRKKRDEAIDDNF